MEIAVLVDNNTLIDNYVQGEPALSFLIKDANCKILFDRVYSDLFLENAKSLNENISDITANAHHYSNIEGSVFKRKLESDT